MEYEDVTTVREFEERDTHGFELSNGKIVGISRNISRFLSEASKSYGDVAEEYCRQHPEVMRE